MLRKVRSFIAAPAKPLDFIIAFLLYAFIWIVVSCALNLLGHRFEWSPWMEPYSLKHAIEVGVLWSLGMIAWNYWRLRAQ
jgi:hypothetical protein